MESDGEAETASFTLGQKHVTTVTWCGVGDGITHYYTKIMIWLYVDVVVMLQLVI